MPHLTIIETISTENSFAPGLELVGSFGNFTVDVAQWHWETRGPADRNFAPTSLAFAGGGTFFAPRGLDGYEIRCVATVRETDDAGVERLIRYVSEAWGPIG